MDPLQQVFAQQEGGSAQGQGFGQFFVAGQQAGLARRRLDLEERQEKRVQRREDLMLPLEQDLMKNQAINMGVVASHNALKLKIDTLANTAMPEIDALTLAFMQSPEGFMDKQGIAMMQQLRRTNPDAFVKGAPGDALMNKVLGTFVGEIETRKKLQQVEEMLGKLQPGTRATISKDGFTVDKDATFGGAGGSPEIKTVTDPTTGKPVSLYRSGPNSWSRVPTQLAGPETATVTDPVTGLPMAYVRTGPNSFSRVPMSTGQQQLEQAEIASGDTFAQGRRLLPLINERTTGIRGGVQRLARDMGVGLLMPEILDPQVSEADAVAREFAAKIVRGLRSDGNINEKEFQALVSEANTLKWVDERTGKTRLAAFVEGAVRKARDASQRLGRPIADQYLTFAEIQARAEAKAAAGEMTQEQAINWGLNAYSNSAELMLKEIKDSIK